MCSGAGSQTLLWLGFPIRTSPDLSSVANSPGLIAGSYVLHRLLVPRHPPCALSSLSLQKMLASTVQFSRCGRSQQARTSLTGVRQFEGLLGRGARCAGLIPQDPTVCPMSSSCSAVPLPTKGVVLAGRATAPNSRRSTSEHESAPRHSPGQQTPWTAMPPNCSLERR